MLTTVRSRVAVLMRELRGGYSSLLFVSGFVVAAVIGRGAGATAEEAFQYAGTSLELLGIGLVAFGLDQTRAAFGKPTLTARALQWGTRVVASLRRRNIVTVVGAGGFAIGGSAAAAFISGTLGDWSVEGRLAALEQDLRRLREEVTSAREAMRTEVAGVRSSLETVAQQGRVRLASIEQRLDEFAVGGLVLEWIGLWWLLAGTVSANLSAELARWTGLV
jgi:hypothetical protein